MAERGYNAPPRFPDLEMEYLASRKRAATATSPPTPPGRFLSGSFQATPPPPPQTPGSPEPSFPVCSRWHKPFNPPHRDKVTGPWVFLGMGEGRGGSGKEGEA